MRYAMLAVALSAAMLGVSVPAASGAVDRAVAKCEGTATWQVSINLAGQSSAVRTLSGGMKACKRVHAGVADDGNFMINSYDNASSGPTNTGNLVGAGVTGVPVFAGVVTSPTGRPAGPIAIVGDSLTVTTASAVGTYTAVEEHTPDGTCGTNCYRTKAIWVVSYEGT